MFYNERNNALEAQRHIFSEFLTHFRSFFNFHYMHIIQYRNFFHSLLPTKMQTFSSFLGGFQRNRGDSDS